MATIQDINRLKERIYDEICDFEQVDETQSYGFYVHLEHDKSAEQGISIDVRNMNDGKFKFGEDVVVHTLFDEDYALLSIDKIDELANKWLFIE